MNIDSYNIKRAIKLFEISNDSITDEEVVELFVNNGIEKNSAIIILLFLPIAFVRNLLPGLRWSDQYIQYTDGVRYVKNFRSNLYYKKFFEETQLYFANSRKRDTVFKIAGRSSSFKAISQLLQNGADLDSIEVSYDVINL